MAGVSSKRKTTSPAHNTQLLDPPQVAAFVVAMLTFGFLAMRVSLASAQKGGLGAALYFLSHFFTILTNTAVGCTMAWTAHRRKANLVPPAMWLALVAAILGVGIVYHIALKHLRTLKPGAEKISDEGVHTVVPLMTLGWWMLFEKRPVDTWHGAQACLVWPLTYSFYILVRAHLFGGFYPYPFLNLVEIGSTQFAINVAGLAIVFAGLGVTLLEMKRGINYLLRAVPKKNE